MQEGRTLPLIRTLLMAAAKQVAADPELRGKATEVARDHVLPAARSAAQKSGEAVRSARTAITEDYETAIDEAPPEATRAEIAGRATRRLLDRLKDPD
jgi:hypothetical protein